jgi:hypothetical protein
VRELHVQRQQPLLLGALLPVLAAGLQLRVA